MQVEASFAQANRSKYPEQIAIAIAKDRRGRCNPITLGWVMQTSHEPPMLAISIGKERYSLEVIRLAKEFVLSYPSEQQAEAALYWGTHSGRDSDKLSDVEAKLQPARKIDCVLLEDAVANFECQVVDEMETGDHVIFVGEVVCAHVSQQQLNRLYTVGSDYQMKGLPRS